MLQGARADRRAREAERDLRREQESAYERSLAQDRERMRARREAEEARKEEERVAKQKALEAEWIARKAREWKRWKVGAIRPEPGAEVKEATRLSIRMPSGERIVRRFGAETTVEELYAFVECYGFEEEEEKGAEAEAKKPVGYEHEYGFKLVSPMPRAVYELADGGTVAERIGRSGNLIVETTIEEDEEDGDGEEE